jgi:HK97 family phage portal protein
MGILNFFTRFIGKNELLRALYQHQIFDGNVNFMADDPTAYLDNGFEGNADVYSIITRILDMSRQASLKLCRKNENDEIEEVTDHPLYQFTIKANPQTPMWDYYDAWGIYLLSTGNSFTYGLGPRSGVNQGRIEEIFILPTGETEIIESGDPFRPIKGYRIEGIWNRIMPAESVFHSKYFNPSFAQDRSLWGLSPLKAASKVLTKQNQAEDTQAKMFENQGPRYMLYKDVGKVTDMGGAGSLEEKQQRAIESKIKRSGTVNRGLPLVLKDKMGIINLGLSPADLKIIESSKDGRRVLCNIYKFPVDLLNDPDGSTYNNKSTARKSAWTDAIIPHQSRFINHLNAMLVKPVEEYVNAGLYFDWDYSNVQELQADMKERVEWMRNASWLRNEIRQATGKDPIDDPIMNSPHISFNEIALGEDGEPEQGAKNFEDYAT